ncbi:FGFR1 oncogene partner [Plectropomus leopardus]|uniref:FGFR1 oncogene partner n=1 Tax=Plectropomus leopardus TaxID=160734 RepID=UPI001C4ADCF5|nr:FGFR1 oncogene partner [Plectropomus leopardus]
MSIVRRKFDSYDKDGSGSVLRDDLTSVFTDLFPALSKNMLARFITDELRAADKTFSKTIDFQLFVGFYRRLFSQCRSVVVQDSDVSVPPEEKSAPPVSKIPRYKGGQSQTAAKDSESAASLGKGDFQPPSFRHNEASDHRKRERPDLDLEVEDDPDDGDSFFDDPLPKPQKTYGCRSSPLGEKDSSERTNSHKDLSVLAADSEDEPDDRLSEHSRSSELSFKLRVNGNPPTFSEHSSSLGDV